MVQERWAVVLAHLFPHRSSKSSYPSLQAQTLTGGWGTWQAALRPDTVIKNGCWYERECQHVAAITHSYKKSSQIAVSGCGAHWWVIDYGEWAECAKRQAGPRRGFAWLMLSLRGSHPALVNQSAQQKKRHTQYLMINGSLLEGDFKILNISRPTYSI